jgi:hypothetical protein
MQQSRQSFIQRQLFNRSAFLDCHLCTEWAHHVLNGRLEMRQSLRRMFRTPLAMLLRSILFFLPIPAPHTLGRQSLVTEGRPGPKVFASLAPFDFQIVVVQDDPDGHIAGCADTLVLTGNNVGGIVVVFLAGRGAGGDAADAHLTAHDAEAFAGGEILVGAGFS